MKKRYKTQEARHMFAEADLCVRLHKGSTHWPIPACLCVCVLLCLFITGCATPRIVTSQGEVETAQDQMQAAQKVFGAMSGCEMSEADMKRVAREMRTDEEAHGAVQKIIAPSAPVVIKYSPVTGKHYSGDLEYDPETGVKLEVLEE